MDDTTELFNSLSLGFVEGLYADFLQDPNSVAPEWQRDFGRLTDGNGASLRHAIGPSFRPASLFNPPGTQTNGHEATKDLNVAVLQDRVDQLIRAYRVRGHMIANLDPLGLPRPIPPELDLDFYGLTEADMDKPFSTRTIYGPDVLTLRGIVKRLRNTYCRCDRRAVHAHRRHAACATGCSTGWKAPRTASNSTREEQLRILTRLTDAVIFEEFIQQEIRGRQELFAGRGRKPDSAAGLGDRKGRRAGHRGDRAGHGPPRPAQRAGEHHAARGRRKSSASSKTSIPNCMLGRGDVKYHLGYSSDWHTAGGQKVHLSLCFNPSHLEFVDPGGVGRMRAKQDRVGDSSRGTRHGAADPRRRGVRRRRRSSGNTQPEPA